MTQSNPRMTDEFSNKVVLVTGSASGLGRAMAEAFAGEGALVIGVDIDANEGSNTVSRILKGGGRSRFFPADMRSEDSIVELFKNIAAEYGRIDCAVNNAGVEMETGEELGRWSSSIMRCVWEINVMGVFHCMQHELRLMRAQGRGAIVNISSVAGVTGAGGKPAYTAAKHAVIGLTKAAAVQFGPESIRVNAICPSVTRTRMYDVQDIPEQVMIDAHPLRRIGEPRDVADAALWLCSDRARNVTGHSLLLDGGYMAS
jgi:NAD(P)-dependent dehydrogenase (short-subunit alcohol dehydrogenase family)